MADAWARSRRRTEKNRGGEATAADGRRIAGNVKPATQGTKPNGDRLKSMRREKGVSPERLREGNRCRGRSSEGRGGRTKRSSPEEFNLAK